MKNKGIAMIICTLLLISIGAIVIFAQVGGVQSNGISKSVGSFTAYTITGEKVTEDVFNEYDLTLVNLWATWCGPCLEEMPDLNALDKEYEEKGVNVITFVMDVPPASKRSGEALATAKQIVQELDLGLMVIVPSEELTIGLLKEVNVYPQSFLVNKSGEIVSEWYAGSKRKTQWEKIIQEHLEKGVKEANE